MFWRVCRVPGTFPALLLLLQYCLVPGERRGPRLHFQVQLHLPRDVHGRWRFILRQNYNKCGNTQK